MYVGDCERLKASEGVFISDSFVYEVGVASCVGSSRTMLAGAPLSARSGGPTATPFHCHFFFSCRWSISSRSLAILRRMLRRLRCPVAVILLCSSLPFFL